MITAQTSEKKNGGDTAESLSTREGEGKQDGEVLAEKAEPPVLRDTEMGRRQFPTPCHRDLKTMVH